jgi:LmbE family N-acetylglucosaminyl deacetylase
MEENQPGVWKELQQILVILAHPDDPEFFCGGTLALWASQGHVIHYLLLTCGDKGFHDPTASPDQICRIRHAEQEAAAAVIGAKSVQFLDREDGYLQPTLELRKEVVRAIRQVRPDILVTCDPTYLFSGDRHINHPDHRYAGQVVLDAVFPAAGNPFFFPDLLQEGLEPHTPKEVWVSLAIEPNVTIDITDTWATKIEALKKHASQIGDPAEFVERMRARKSDRSTTDKDFFDEKFRIIRYK